MRPILCKYSEIVILPGDALGIPLEQDYYTADGVRVRVEFQTTWNNVDGDYDTEIDNECNRYFECSFQRIRSLWIGRIGKVGNWWHKIKLVKI